MTNSHYTYSYSLISFASWVFIGALCFTAFESNFFLLLLLFSYYFVLINANHFKIQKAIRWDSMPFAAKRYRQIGVATSIDEKRNVQQKCVNPSHDDPFRITFDGPELKGKQLNVNEITVGYSFKSCLKNNKKKNLPFANGNDRKTVSRFPFISCFPFWSWFFFSHLTFELKLIFIS